MTTIVVDSEYSNDLLEHIDQDVLFGSPFVMDDLYDGTRSKKQQQQQPYHHQDNVAFESCRASDCSSEEDYYDHQQLQIHAPPPSPQDTCMLDMLFSQKLTCSLEACLKEQEEEEEEDDGHEELPLSPPEDKLLLRRRSTSSSSHRQQLQGRRNGGVCKKTKIHKRSTSTISSCNSIWYQRAKTQKFSSIVKATEQAEKLRIALQKHLMDEETKIMINELKDMGL